MNTLKRLSDLGSLGMDTIPALGKTSNSRGLVCIPIARVDVRLSSERLPQILTGYVETQLWCDNTNPYKLGM